VLAASRRYLDSDHGDSMCLRNVGNTAHIDTVQRPKSRISACQMVLEINAIAFLSEEYGEHC
jgi:hypothetical protein